MTHQELLDSAASYALGALDGDERAALEAHLPGCAECQAAVASFQEVAATLAAAAPPAPPMRNGDAVRARLVQRAHEDRVARGVGVSPGEAPVGVTRVGEAPARETPAGDARDTPVRDIATARGARPWATRAGWLAAAAALALAAVLGSALRSERAERTAERARLAAELADARTQLALRDSTLAAFLGPEVHVVSLAEPSAKPTVRVFWNHTRQVFIITAQGLPAPPPGKTYQLWALRNGQQPLSMGTFASNASGRAAVVVPVSAEITAGGFIHNCALTVEPAGGSAGPTETPRLVGEWRHTD